ncbi:MAG: IucA/IucC family siderophore biosynthesis protein [Bacteroidota bacterium]
MKKVFTKHPSFRGAEVLTEENWNIVNRRYVVKSISELMHELLLMPKEVETLNDGGVQFLLDTDDPAIQYTFIGYARAMGHWHIPESSLIKTVNGEAQNVDGLAFYLELEKVIAIDPFTLTRFLDETYKTLYADAYMRLKSDIPVEQLIDMDSQDIEHQMKGHPWATVNKGRNGFSINDHEKFAPESNRPVQLSWVAVHKIRASYQSTAQYSFASLMEQELGKDLVSSFHSILERTGVNPDDYFFIPIHDWQWKNKLVFYFAKDIANKMLIPLRTGTDNYSPQQSIRTFFNLTHPEKCYVKTAISILNTSVYRGLSPKKLKRAPFITEWIQSRLANDSYLQGLGCIFLGEIASVAYEHPHFGAIEKAPYQFKDMLGVIWRESAQPHLDTNEKMITMAALMHVDEEDESFMKALIDKSGLSPQQWIEKYLNCYFKPLLHCFYHHGLCFSPHGENTMLILENYVPKRIIIKDFVEEIHLNQDEYKKAPEQIRQIIKEVPNEYVSLFILSGVFDGVFRYISNIAKTYFDYPEIQFWSQVAIVIKSYQQEHPELEYAFQKFDLFVPEFIRVGFNRVRLLEYGYNDNTDIPELNACGNHKNPMVAFAENEMELV